MNQIPPTMTDHQPDADTNPGAIVPTGLEPEINLPGGRVVVLKLVASEAEAPCNFWVGVAPSGGKLDPANILDLGPAVTVLAEAASKGISEPPPIMLTETVPPGTAGGGVAPGNAKQSGSRHVYLMPIPGDDFRDRAVWIHELAATIRSWAPRSAGFYLDPELVNPGAVNELLSGVLRELIRQSATTEFYLLIGAHGINAILNTALRLKAELESDAVNLFVYH